MLMLVCFNRVKKVTLHSDGTFIPVYRIYASKAYMASLSSLCI